MPRLLVTGFGPFPSMPRNPSAALARRVAASPRWRLADVAVESRVLTTAYAALGTELDPALERHPDAVLMIGVAGRSRRIRVERRATARRSTLFPDVAGEMASVAASSAPRLTRANTAAALRAIARRGRPVRLSRDAGRYLCNASYFRALARPVPVLFVHIPKPDPARPAGRRVRRLGPEEALAAALVEIALGMLRERRVAAPRRPG